MGHFCGIYGIGAVVMILTLQYFSKTNHRLFMAGVVVGAIVEYTLSLIGELLLHAKWWDYSDKFLNINGRICLLYSFFWGLLGVYLIKVFHPKVDNMINYFKGKMNLKILKIFTVGTIVFIVIDCVISGMAVDLFLMRVAITKDLDIENKEQTKYRYETIYHDEKKASFINRYWNDEKMIKVYPNLTIKLRDGSMQAVKNYFPDIKPYYYKW